MIELLRIHTLVCTVRALIFIGDAADKFGNACYRKAIKLEVFAWRLGHGAFAGVAAISGEGAR
jgi:hypothetical protein